MRHLGNVVYIWKLVTDWLWHDNECVIAIKKINAVKNFNTGKKLITQTGSANSEHNHSETQRFSKIINVKQTNN